MTLPWFISHHIRENFDGLQEKYAGKTVTFHVDNYDTLHYRLKDPAVLNITVTKIEEDFLTNPFQAHTTEFYTYYFLSEEEYQQFKQNLAKKLKNLTEESFRSYENSLENYIIKVIDTFPFQEIDQALFEKIDKMMKKQYPPILIHKHLSLRGSKKYFNLLRKYKNSKYVNNLTASLQYTFDYKTDVSKDNIDFIVKEYQRSESNNYGLFLKEVIYYIPGFKEKVKEILYNPKLDLLNFYYGAVFDAIEEDLPEILKEKILEALETLKKNEKSKITSSRVYTYRTTYLEELQKLQKKFMIEKPNKDIYVQYLDSLPTMNEKMKDIEVRYQDEQYSEQIKIFFEAELKNKEGSLEQKLLVVDFLTRHAFTMFNELIPSLKELLHEERRLEERSLLQKLSFSEQELRELLNHPSKNVRMYAGEKLLIEFEEMAKYLDQFRLFKNYSPILVIDGRPQFTGGLKRDLRILEIINKLEKTRYKEITPTRRVIQLQKAEFNQIMTQTNYFFHQGIFEKIMKSEELVKYYLLVDEKQQDPSTQEMAMMRSKLMDLTKQYSIFNKK